jgi:hypothetical protein
MRQPKTVKALEELGRTRLSTNFFMRDFLYSEIAALHGFTNIPDDPDLAIAAGTALCETLLDHCRIASAVFPSARLPFSRGQPLRQYQQTQLRPQ